MWETDEQPPAPGEPIGVAPGVVGLLAPNANEWTFEGTNSYLVAGSRGAVIVDPGPDDEAHLDRIDQLLRAAGVRVTDVLLTHHHGDHAHAARAAATRWGAVVRPRVHAGVIADGTTLDLGGVEVRAVRTPGHTADGVSFVVPQHRLVLAGDTVLARVNPYIHHPDGTVDDMLRSMRRLAGLVDDDWALLPGHGPLVRTPRTFLDRRVADRHRRIEQVAALLRDGVPREGVAEVVYSRATGGRLRAARASVDAILHYLDSRAETPAC